MPNGATLTPVPVRPSPQAEAAWRGLLTAHARLATAFDAELRAEHSLALEDYDVLLQLAEHGGSLPMGELAAATLVPRSSCTRIVDRLARRALVEREHDPDDRRVLWARLTPAGRRVQRRAALTHLASIQRRFGTHFTDAEAAELARLLTRIGAGQGA